MEVNKKSFLDILFPEHIKCIACDAELPLTNSYCLCDTCLTTLPFLTKGCLKCDEPIISGDICLNCKRDGRYFYEHRAVFKYDGVIVNLIQNFKYYNGRYLGPYLSNLLVDKFKTLNWQIDVVIPVPLHPERQKHRGFNQAYLLTKSFQQIDLPINQTALIRTKYLSQQATLSKKERLTNLKDAFKVADKKAIAGKSVLLIDDILTTGNTIDMCAKTLLKAGAKIVYAMCVCRTAMTSILAD